MPDNQLQTSNGSRITAPASNGCSPELWRLLTAKGSARDIAPQIAGSPSLLSETRAIAANLDERQRGCGRVAVVGHLMPLVTVYGLPERSEQEWGTYWTIYADTLCEVPTEALREAILLHNQTGKFFPKPGELFQLAKPAAERIRIAAWRAKKALECDPPRQREPLTAEQRAQFIDMLADIRMKRMPRAPRKVNPVDLIDVL